MQSQGPSKWKKKSEEKTRVGSLGRTQLDVVGSEDEDSEVGAKNEGGSQC